MFARLMPQLKQAAAQSAAKLVEQSSYALLKRAHQFTSRKPPRELVTALVAHSYEHLEQNPKLIQETCAEIPVSRIKALLLEGVHAHIAKTLACDNGRFGEKREFDRSIAYDSKQLDFFYAIEAELETAGTRRDVENIFYKILFSPYKYAFYTASPGQGLTKASVFEFLLNAGMNRTIYLDLKNYLAADARFPLVSSQWQVHNQERFLAIQSVAIHMVKSASQALNQWINDPEMDTAQLESRLSLAKNEKDLIDAFWAPGMKNLHFDRWHHVREILWDAGNPKSPYYLAEPEQSASLWVAVLNNFKELGVPCPFDEKLAKDYFIYWKRVINNNHQECIFTKQFYASTKIYEAVRLEFDSYNPTDTEIKEAFLVKAGAALKQGKYFDFLRKTEELVYAQFPDLKERNGEEACDTVASHWFGYGR